jgi:hypothetical protein
MRGAQNRYRETAIDNRGGAVSVVSRLLGA